MRGAGALDSCTGTIDLNEEMNWKGITWDEDLEQ